MAAPAIAGKAAYLTANIYWRGNLKTKLAGLSVGAALNDVYYDGELCDFRIKDQTSDGTTWNPAILRSYQENDYYVNTTAVPAGAVAGFRNFTDGFLQDWLRTTANAAAAKASIIAIGTNGAYVNGNGGDPLSDQSFSREVAYGIKTFINLTRSAGGAGTAGALSAAQTARLGVLFEYALGHLDQWSNGTASYCRPFMVGITAKELIDYYLYISADARILTKLTAVAEYIWGACWKSVAGTWGVGQSMLYTDRNTGDPDDTYTQPDLNMMYCPIYGWLWSKTGSQLHRTRGDAILAGGTPVYNGAGTVQISGAYQGTASNPAGKQIDQQMYWGPDYILYGEANANPVTMTAINTSTIAIPSGSPKVNPTRVTFAIINTLYTIGAPIVSTNRVFVCGCEYQSSLAHNLTITSTTVGDMLFQRNAGDGFQIQPQVKAFYIGEPGETVQVKSSALISDILFFWYEAPIYQLT